MIDLLALCSVFLGVTAQAFFGLGFGLFAAPLLFLIDPAYVPAPVILLGFLLSGFQLVKTRHFMMTARVCFAVSGRMLGTGLGVLLLMALSEAWLGFIFSLLIIATTLVTRFRFSIHPNRINLAVAGFISGVIGTATSVGGPPMAIVYQNSDRRQARDDLTQFFFWGTLFAAIALYLSSSISVHAQVLTLKMMPGLVLGLLAAAALEKREMNLSVRDFFITASLLSSSLILIRSVYYIATG